MTRYSWPARSAGLFRLASLPALLLLALPSSAQREWGGAPPSFDPENAGAARLTLPPPIELLPNVDNEALLAEDAQAPRGGAQRFAHAHVVDLDASRDGTWRTLDDGSRVWRLQLHSPGAYSLALLFSRFQLPAGAELYVYDETREVVRGAYTSRNHKPNGQFAVQPTPGDTLNLEYWEPAGTDSVLELTLGSVYHAYRPFFGAAPSRTGLSLGSGACQVDVACPEGVPFADETDGIVQIQNGIFRCSGALVNNTAGDGRLLVLTAEHCRNNNSLDNAVFAFNFKESTCGGTGAAITDTVSGSVTLAVDAPLDFALLELSEQPPESFGVKYLGWDRSDVPPAAGTVGLHHPDGDPMKIAVDNDPPSFNGTFWNIGTWEVATTEGGSSGSPLLDMSGRIIGQLSNGTADCTNPSNDNYGRLAAEWALVGPFLDPLGTGAVTLDLFDPNAGSSDPLAVSGTTPSDIPILMPGTGQDVQVMGSGFQDGMSMTIGGVPVTSFTRRTAGLITLDLPELPLLGSQDLVLTKSTETVTASVNVAAPDPIAFQAGDGDPGNSVGSFTGVDLSLGGAPGDLHLIVYSFSNVPSSHPLWMIEIGNSFTDLISLGCHFVGPQGITTFNVPISGISLTSLYGQTTNITGGAPFEVSNLQEIFVVF